MAGLLVALAVMAVMATAAMPVWKTLAQREKEAELIFRGEQYARAIGLFQRKMGPGTLPPTVEVLVKQHFLRKAYKDPIANGDFQLLYAGQNVAGAPGGQGAAAPGAGGVGVGARPGQPGQQAGPGPGVAAGIQGVVSKSTDQSIRQYNSRSHYNEWTFIHVPQAQAPGVPAGAGAPGVGRGGQSGPLGAAGQGGPLGSGGGRGGPLPRGGPGQGPGGGRGFGGPGGAQGPGGRGGG